ncbi:MAG: hypothetical protein ACOYJK_02040 [Prevotella sp.]|jgi:hypothetical protein
MAEYNHSLFSPLSPSIMRHDPEKDRLKAEGYAIGKHPSMLRRSVYHDYSGRQMYMVTLTTERRRPLFGHLAGDVTLPTGHPHAPHIVLSELGKAVEAVMLSIPRFHPRVSVIKLQMMPDHLHLILFVSTSMQKPLGEVIRGAKLGCNKAYRTLAGISSFKDAGAEGVKADFPPFYRRKHASRYDQWDPEHPNRERGQLFSPGYHDGILKDNTQLERWIAYLDDNPRRALVKRQHPDYFRVRRNVQVAGLTFSAIGNIFLLQWPVKIQVQCSRRLTAVEIEKCQKAIFTEAEQGAVLVSPSISPGEKTIMRAAFERRFPEIILEENGFTDCEKPKGSARFDACSRGQMLFLSPWGHHHERKTIQRGQCMQLNDMARIICNTCIKNPA